MGLIQWDGEKVKLTNKIFLAGSQVSSQLIQDYHRTINQKGSNALESIAIDKREFGAATIAVKKDEIAEIKKDIRALLQKAVERTANTTDAEEIYQLNVQFFPFTQKKD